MHKMDQETKDDNKLEHNQMDGTTYVWKMDNKAKYWKSDDIAKDVLNLIQICI